MRSSTLQRRDGQLRACALAAAILSAVLLLTLAPGAKGQSITEPGADEDPTGAPYVAGELLVAYKAGTSEEAEAAVVRELGGQTLENLPGEVRLISLSGIKRGESRGARERALQRKLNDLREDPRVEAADYNYIREASFTPNDPRFDDQWGLTKARFPGAWNDAQGAGAKIAIVDSGIDSNHPDIGNIVAQNDFVESDAVADDDNGHGTHVAGIAGALTNNEQGVAGGCHGCGLLIAKVINANGDATDTNVVAGINWSVSQGADVVNISLGGPAESTVLKAAVDNASAGGVVVVAAAGNKGTTKKQYPAAYSAVIAVSATNDKDKLATFSSHGNWVDLSAPGTRILSTVPTNGCNVCLRPAGTNYESWSGTSMSAPFVSALAGLLASRDPGLSADQIRQRMEATAMDLGPAGEDPYFGYGRINANSAVE